MSDTAVQDPQMEALVAQAKQLKPDMPAISAPVQQEQALPTQSAAPVQDSQMDALAAQAKQIQPQVSATKQTIEPIPQFQGFVSNIGKQLNVGTDTLGSDLKSFVDLGLTNKSYEQFEEEDAAYHAWQQVTHPEDVVNTAIHDNMQQALEPMGTTVGNAMVQSVPTLGLTATGMAVGGLAAFTIGAPVTVPVLAGGAVVGAVVGAGGMIKSMREHGADPNIARAAGLLAGAANAATMFIGGAGASKVAETVVEEGTRAVVKQMAKTMGINAIAMELNNLADTAIKWASMKYKPEELQQELLQGAAQTLVAAPTFAAGGALLGKALKPMATAAEYIAELSAAFNKILETRKAERFEKLRAEMFPEVVKAEEEAKKQAEKKPTETLQGSVQYDETGWNSATKALVKEGEKIEAKAAKKEAEAAQKALKEAEEADKKLQEERYIPDTVDEAVLIAQVAQGAAGKLAKGKPIFQSKKKLIGGVKAFWERYSPWSRISGYATVSPAGKLRIIFQDHPNAEPLIEKLDTFHAVQAYDTLHRQFDEKYYGHLEESTGLNRDELNWLIFKASSDELVVDYVGADGQPVHEEISADMALSYLSLMKNKDALVALTDAKTGNNMTVNTPELPGKLTTEKAYTDALEAANPAYLGVLEGRANFYAEMGPLLKSTVAKNEPGKTFNLQANYGITIRRRGAVDLTPTDYTPVAPGGDFTNPIEGIDQNAPGFTEERGASKQAIEVDGCFQADKKRCRQQARYQAMWEPAKLWNALKGSLEFKNAVENKFRNGKMLYNSTMSSYEDAVHGAAKAEDGWDKFCNAYLKANAVHKLGWNPVYIPKHVATFYNFTLYKYKGKFIPPEALLKGAKSALAHPKAAAKLVLGWEDIKTRYADINQLAAITNDEAENPAFTRVRRSSTSMLRTGDQGAVIMGGKAIYDHVFGLTGNAKTAEREAVKAINEVLASGSHGQISSMARHPIGRLFANLHQPQMRLAQHALEAQRLAANHPTKENIANAVRVTAINHIASGLFSLPSVGMAGIGAAITGNATGLSEAAYQAYTNFLVGSMFPIGDSAVKAAFTDANNYVWDDKHHVWELSAGPLESTHKSYMFAGDVSNLISGNKEADFDNVFKAAMHGIQGPGSLAPVPEWPIKAVGSGVSSTQ